MFVKPMKAKKDNHKGVPQGDYLYETKYDGIRAILVWQQTEGLTIYSKSGRDISQKFPELMDENNQHALLPYNAIFDAEIVCLKDGIPDFGAITSRFHLGSKRGWDQGAKDDPVTVMLFDIIRLNGEEVMDHSLAIRKRLLYGCLLSDDLFTLSETYEDGEALYEHEKNRGAEGIIAKKKDSTYQPGRRLRDWLKVKIMYREKVVITGFIDGKGKREGQFGSLIFEGIDGRPAGKVGTGFTDAELESMTAKLRMCGPMEVKPGVYNLAYPFRAVVEGMKKNKSGAIREPTYICTADY